MRLLWLIDLEYQFEMRHGASLRFFGLAHELMAQGHDVCFATRHKPEDDPILKGQYLERLREERFLSGHIEIDYAPPTPLRRLAQLAIHPALVNGLLRSSQEAVCRRIEAFVNREQIDACIVSNRALLFVVPRLGRTIPMLIDWIDSMTLFWLREIRLQLGARRLAALPYGLRRLIEDYLAERYYGAKSALNLAVSPLDKRWLDLVNRRRRHNCVLLNGVHVPHVAADVAPVKDRLIFTGNMDFPPNYEAAIWFVDHVIPLLRQRRPDIVIVIAGANPVPQLVARQGPNVVVTGRVDDLALEIARSQLCVAPLVSGGGFKNKVIEAIAANRYVVATSRAAEFLDATARSRLLIGDTPAALAEHILSYLESPERYQAALDALREVVSVEFTWANRARQLLARVRACTSDKTRMPPCSLPDQGLDSVARASGRRSMSTFDSLPARDSDAQRLPRRSRVRRNG
jgi:glycosyltransferase involved in cell wall biosynthesis